MSLLLLPVAVGGELCVLFLLVLALAGDSCEWWASVACWTAISH